MSNPKISIIGAGNIGATTAHWIAGKNLADVVILNRTEGKAKGKALDLLESAPIMGFDVKISGTSDYKDIENSDIVVITAGAARKPGMSRDELLETNVKIVSDISENIKKHAPGSIIIVVTNPLDVMVTVAHRVSGFPKNRVIGMAGILDTARMKTFISQELDVPVGEIEALILGGHGDTMVPLIRFTKVNGKSLSELLPAEKLEAIVQRTRDGGAEIVGYLEDGSAYYAPSAGVLQMCEAILHDTKLEVPCAAYLDGQYGVKGLFIGVPVILGRNGVEKIVEVELNSEERAAFEKTVEHVKGLVGKI